MQDRHPGNTKRPQPLQRILALVGNRRESRCHDGRRVGLEKRRDGVEGSGREVRDGEEAGEEEGAEDVQLRVDLVGGAGGQFRHGTQREREKRTHHRD